MCFYKHRTGAACSVPCEPVGPTYIKFERLNDYGRICDAMQIGEQFCMSMIIRARPPAPIPLTLAPIVSSPTTHGAMRTRRSRQTWLTLITIWLVHRLRSSTTAKVHRFLYDRLEVVDQTAIMTSSTKDNAHLTLQYIASVVGLCTQSHLSSACHSTRDLHSRMHHHQAVLTA